MSRISSQFVQLNAENRKGFIPFVTAGDPDIDTSLRICRSLADLGADVIELGVPFSDPMADGPTIQRSSMRSLANGTSLSDVLDMATRFRMSHDTPLVIFTYFNPVHRYGVERFANEGESAGVDGVLLTDVIGEEAKAIADLLGEKSIDLISLVAPTTTDERLLSICENARGFIYAVARAGVTGAQSSMTSDAESLCSRVRQFTDLPIAVGFGISNAEHIRNVWNFADAAVVGSAIVSEIEKALSSDEAITNVETFVKQLLPPKR